MIDHEVSLDLFLSLRKPENFAFEVHDNAASYLYLVDIREVIAVIDKGCRINTITL